MQVTRAVTLAVSIGDRGATRSSPTYDGNTAMSLCVVSAYWFYHDRRRRRNFSAAVSSDFGAIQMLFIIIIIILNPWVYSSQGLKAKS